MTLTQIKYFIAVCEYGSLSLASEHLYVTQPTLSLAITSLENKYNIILFDRKNNALTITEEGMFFYEKAKVILESIDMLEKDLIHLAEKNSIIKIGIPPMIGSFLFPQIYDEYRKYNPNVKFEIWEEGSISIRNRIQNHTLDLGFSILNDSHNSYNQIAILETELLYFVAKDNPLAKKEVLTIEDIKNEHIMMMKEGFFQTKLINAMFEEINEIPKINFVSTQLSIILKFVKMNMGGAFLIKELIDSGDESVVGLSFKDKIKLKIGLIWPKDAKLSSGANDFIAYIRKH